MAVATKRVLYRLVDQIPPAELPAARLFLEYLRDAPLQRALREAPLDDEQETPEEAVAVARAREDLAAGRVLPHETVRRRWLTGAGRRR